MGVNWVVPDDFAGSFDSYDPNAGEDVDTSNVNSSNMGPSPDWGFSNEFGMDQSYDQQPGLDMNWMPQGTKGPMQNYASMSMDVPKQNTMQGGGTQAFLEKLFSNPGLMGKGIAALFEGNQNKKMGSAMNNIARTPALDPFGSQRPFYQQQLQNTVQDPYNQPMVKAQIDNVQRMQNIKDAASGRRSNMVSSAPGVASAQAAIAQQYMNSLMNPAGANINPNGKTISQLLSSGAKYNTNGYSSPLADVFGFGNRQNDLQQLIDSYRG